MARPAKKPPARRAKPAPKKPAGRAKPHRRPLRPAAVQPVAAIVDRPRAEPAATTTIADRPRAKSPLTEREIEQTRVDLMQQRDMLARELADLEAGSLSVSQSELSGEASFDEEYADAGTFTFERERDLSLGNNIRDLLEKSEHALRRIAEGRYGLCDRCGQPIDKARLKALPYATLCVRCKQLEEGSL